MRRGYSSGDYRALIERIRAKVPQVGIATDIIVGFCGETEQQFMHTLDLLEELKLDIIHIAQYSTRPNTTAPHATWWMTCRPKRRSAASRALEEQHERLTAQINARYMGTNGGSAGGRSA